MTCHKPHYVETWRHLQNLKSQWHQRRIKPWSQPSCVKHWWSLAMLFLRYANGQTDRQTDMLIAVLCTKRGTKHCDERICLSVCCVTSRREWAYCHSILFVCLSVIKQPTAYHDWSITTKFGRQVHTCPRMRVSLFRSPVSDTLGSWGKIWKILPISNNKGLPFGH